MQLLATMRQHYILSLVAGVSLGYLALQISLSYLGPPPVEQQKQDPDKQTESSHSLDKKEANMAETYVTQSQAKDNKDIDPDYDLIMNDDLAQNQWPKAADEIKATGKGPLSVQGNSKIDPDYDLIMDDDLAQNKWPKALDEVKAKGGKIPLMAQIMTPELYAKYKDIKTSKAGWTIARAINTGVCYPSSFVGCHAGDLESYSTFGELFRPVIEKYHVGYKLDGSMKHVTDMNPEAIGVDLLPNAQSKIISTRIRVARNLAMFPLNPASSAATRLEVTDLMEKVFQAISGSDEPSEKDLGGKFYRHTTMTPEETQQLIDDHFLFRGRDKMQAASGYHRFWPEGRGIFCSQDKKFLLWVNEGDHLRIISMEQGGDVKSVFSRLSRGAKAIEKYVKQVSGQDQVFMSDPILGMITCCPTNIGTGMRGSVHILVPKLIKSIGFDKIDEIARSMNCQARGSTGEHSEVIDRIDISNWRRLGFPEYELVRDMINCVNKLAQMEDDVKE